MRTPQRRFGQVLGNELLGELGHLTTCDPFAIVAVKTGVAAVVNIGLALLINDGAVPLAFAAVGAPALGAVTYAVNSIALILVRMNCDL